MQNSPPHTHTPIETVFYLNKRQPSMPRFHQKLCLRNFMSCFHGCRERVLFGAKIICTIGLAGGKIPKESKHIYSLSRPANGGTKLASPTSSLNCMQLVAAWRRLLVEEERMRLGYHSYVDLPHRLGPVLSPLHFLWCQVEF